MHFDRSREETLTQVGALVAFLVSEQARFITGTAVNIDGGISAVV